MKLYRVLILCAIALAIAPPIPAQFFGGATPKLNIVGVGALASRPATCTANKDAYVCNGTGCRVNGSQHLCTATNTWTDPTTVVGIGALASRPATCTANQDVYICNGAGCNVNGSPHLCSSTNTWVDPIPFGGGGGLFPAFTPVIDGLFSWGNQQTATYSYSNNIEYISFPTFVGDQIVNREKAVPGATPWSVTVAVTVAAVKQNVGGTGGGLIVRDTVAGKEDGLLLYTGNGGGSIPVPVCISGSFPGWGAQATSNFDLTGMITFLKVRNDGAGNLVFSASKDGVNFLTACTRTITTDFGAGHSPNKVGFFVQSEGASQPVSIAVFSWIEGT